MLKSETFQVFEPSEYLKEYYSNIGPENHGLLEFFAEAYEGIEDNSLVLEFGGGPTIYQLITAARKAREIHFSDFLGRNLKEVDDWRKHPGKAFDWAPFFLEALHLEGLKQVTFNDLASRMQLVRKKMKRFLYCDAFLDDPLGPDYRHFYDVVSTNFVVDSITTDKRVWTQLMKNTSSMLRRRGGDLILTSLKEAEYYRVGNRKFPAVYLTEGDIVLTLKELGFQDFLLRSIPAEAEGENEGYKGYNGMIFIRASR